MGKAKPQEFNRIVQGIADYNKEAPPYSISFIRRIDYRSDPRKWVLFPGATKESGSTILDLPKWLERVNDTVYAYGDTGYLYSRSLTGTVTSLRQVAGASGNGLRYFGEDDFLYYATDTTLGRYGRMASSPAFVDDFLGAEGGVPTNTASMDFEAGSSMSADAADSATLSITGDLTMHGFFKFESLPTAGSEMVLGAKWEEQNNDRSYKMSLAGISGFFGDGSSGVLTIAADTTQAPIDSACTGTAAAYTLTATNASFAAGQRIFIHQTKGTGAGTWQINTISSYTAGTITLEDALNASYVTGAQVIVLLQYTNVTVNTGKTWTAKAWNGTVGGILCFLASGTLTVTGAITAKGKGFAGGTGNQSGVPGEQGDSATGTGTTLRSANGAGGGGGEDGDGAAAGGGGGGGHRYAGVDGEPGGRGGGYGGDPDSNAHLTDLTFGGGGGAGGRREGGVGGGNGGNSGGIILLFAVTIVVTGTVSAAGNDGSPYGGGASSSGGGGGGTGGAILIKAQTATLGTELVTAAKGVGGAGKVGSNNDGGAAGKGRIHLDYITSYTGTTNPALDVAQDTELGGNVAYHLRLYISDDGTDEEYYTKEIADLVVDSWRHLAVAWDASASKCYFYVDAALIGTATGSMTAIDDNATVFNLGADKDDSGDTRSFFDGKMDQFNIWSDIRTAGEIAFNMFVQQVGTEANLVASYRFNSATTDETAASNDLTLRNTPTYDTNDVPFSAPTTRRDIDQAAAETGDTCATSVAIDETATGRQSFVPAKDPQKSIEISISDTGDDPDWTITVHDALNREVASKTIAFADITTGDNEFIFDEVWVPVIGATYHFHVTTSTTTGAPAVLSSTNNDLEDADFTSYYQFLVEDSDYHPIDQLLNTLVIGNGRYVATYDGATYDPHRLTFPSGWKVRCLAKWREFEAFGLWKGDDISDYDQGMIIFWDGISDTYNHFIDVPQGAINAMFGSQGTLYIIAGYQGDLLEYTGGDKPKKVKRLPNIKKSEQIEIMPGAITMWQTLLRIGAGVTDTASFEQGVYTWGALTEGYPDSLSYDYYISTETTKSTGVKIGVLLPVAKKLLIGWKDNVSYGLDSIDLSGNPVSSGSIEFTIIDSGRVSKEKLFEIVRADFKPLVDGESVGLQYKLDRADVWETEETETTADANLLRMEVKGGRHKEYQVKVNLATSVATSPNLLGVTIGEDMLEGEEQL